MHVPNKIGRYHIVMQSAQKIARHNPLAASLAEDLLRKYEAKIAAHRTYVTENGIDPPEIADWSWHDP